MVLLERNLHGHPLAGLLWERKFEELRFEKGWDKVPTWECLHAHKKLGLFLSVHLDDVKMIEETQNMDSLWKILQKNRQ